MLESLAVKIRTVDGLDALLDDEHRETHASGHPEMQGNFGLVIDTLQNATAVFRSKRPRNKDLFERACERDTWKSID